MPVGGTLRCPVISDCVATSRRRRRRPIAYILAPVNFGFTLVKLVCVLLVAGVLCAGFVVPYIAGLGFAANKATDKFLDTKCTLKAASLQQTTSVYARDGKTLIAKFYQNNRKSVPLSTVPKTVQQALIDTEDRRFRKHHGVDVRGLARAALNNNSSGATQGASTLTQQLVKQIREYTAATKAEQDAATAKTADRKIYEAKCALDLENRYSKNQILEQYLNIAYFGEQAYGIYVAAKTYFDKTPAQLTVPEAAVLTGLVKDPSLYDPFQHGKQARERRDEVIQNMANAGDITAKAAAAYKRTPIATTSTPVNLGAQGCAFSNDRAITNVGFFCQYAMNWLENKLPDQIGGGLTENLVATGGYKIVTSIDPAMQNKAQKVLSKYPATSATTVIQPAVNPANGEVLSLATSKHYAYGNIPIGKAGYTSIDLFKGAYSGSGSTYKYFTTIAALEAGVRSTQKLTTAGPKTQVYKPKNCGKLPKGAGVHNAGHYGATLTLRDALVQSSNTFFVGVEDQVFDCDLSTVVDTATNLGMNALAERPDKSTPSPASLIKRENQYTFTLGQSNTSALELGQAYGVAANDGVACAARPILSITDVTGKPVSFRQPSCTRKLDPWVARTVVDIMKGDTTTGTAARYFGPNFYGAGASQTNHWVASKTGTNNSTTCDASRRHCTDSSSNSSIWFVGLTPRFVAVSAIINVKHPVDVLDIPKSISTTSAADIFGAFSSTFWIDSFKSMLENESWKWQSPGQVPDAQDTPSVLGYLPDKAETIIRNAGFVPVRYPIDCGSTRRTGVVAYFGPQYAAPGSKVTYCVSNGKALKLPPPPPTPTGPATGTLPTTGGANGTGTGGTTKKKHATTQSQQAATQPGAGNGTNHKPKTNRTPSSGPTQAHQPTHAPAPTQAPPAPASSGPAPAPTKPHGSPSP